MYLNAGQKYVRSKLNLEDTVVLCKPKLQDRKVSCIKPYNGFEPKD